jgi:hypothetical protein
VGRSIMQSPGKLVACCSTAMSVAILFGGPLAIDDSPAAHTTVLWIADHLKTMLDQNSVEEFASVILQNRWISQLELGGGYEELAARTETKNARTFAAVVPPAPSSETRQTPQTETAPSPDAKPSERTSRIPLVVWPFDEPGAPSILVLSRSHKAVTGFLISGKNASDEPFMDVEGALKPDSSHGEIKLDLSLDPNHSSNGSVRTIPPGAQFTLVYTFPHHPEGLLASTFLSKFGGVIFTFHYTHAGVEKTFICYFPAARFKTELQVETTGRVSNIESR